MTNLFAIPTGVDFGTALLAGLEQRHGDLDPADFARIEIFVNTRRTQRRLRDLFDAGPPRLLPRIRLITDLAHDPGAVSIPPATAPLRRRLQVAQLVGGLLEADPSLAPKEARFDLADSLNALMAEMHGEGVSPDILHSLDVADQSGHWQRALDFVALVQDYINETDQAPDAEHRLRQVVEALIARWAETPPDHPVIVAGSTGSRGTTALFMNAVARLRNGAVVLPGVDPFMPAEVWDRLDPAKGGEDHPQFRFKRLCDALDVHPSDLPYWADAPVSNPDRGKLISLSLRPAPVTDQWITDGPALTGLGAATERVTLLETPSPRAEASAVAVKLRQAVEQGMSAALVTPDRVLARQVSSALDRWGITADDSAGIPLQLTPPGRFLRHTADLLAGPLTAEALLVLLKHPLCHVGSDRGPHNLATTALELHIRRHGPPFPDARSLRDWARDKKYQRFQDWADWLADLLPGPAAPGVSPLADLIERHLTMTEALVAGSDGSPDALWDMSAGREARRIMADLASHADAGGALSPTEYAALIGNLLSQGEVRNPDEGHPGVLIWGTLEARVQSADLVILGGMNEGTWPEPPTPDPWLNRRMRAEAGLLLPERRIGLAAHDYQIAMNAPEVVISRAIRSDEAETVPSRWVNRLTNLLNGLEETGGPDRLKEMRRRGDDLLAIAARIEQPVMQVAPAPRPSPLPPVDARPKQLSVTQIKTLIRDPYAIYAGKVLGLKKLDPLTRSADAPLRGIIIHEVLEAFIKERPDATNPKAKQRLMHIAEAVLSENCPWPAAQRLWLARIERFSDAFLAGEAERQARAKPRGFELWGEARLDGLDFTLTAKADRMDMTEDGHVLIYDYKTGAAPTKKQQRLFDKQLLLEAAMVERGAFAELGKAPVQTAEFLQLSSEVKAIPAPLDEASPDEIWDAFTALMRKWSEPWLGYTSRRANLSLRDRGDFDHLARYGEWDETQDAVREDLS